MKSGQSLYGYKKGIVFFLPSLVDAKRLHYEKWYQQQWCQEQGGRGCMRGEMQVFVSLSKRYRKVNFTSF